MPTPHVHLERDVLRHPVLQAMQGSVLPEEVIACTFSSAGVTWE